MSMQLASAASARLELLIRRLFALTLLLSFIEALVISSTQWRFTNLVSDILFVALLICVLAIQINSLRGQQVEVWLYIFGFLSILGMLVWPWAVLDYSELPGDYQPWIWWVVGMGVVAIGIAARPAISLTYLAVVTSLWLLVDTGPWAGALNVFGSLQDASYIFLFGGTVLGLFFLVREAVGRVDEANSQAIQSALEQAKTDAIERERQRIDALVHDKVLNTLLLAVKAESTQDKDSVSVLAREAIASLRQASNPPSSNGHVTPLGLFRALRKAARATYPAVEVEIQSGGSVEIPSDVAKAITEATLQALDNAAKHSEASSIKLRLSSPTPSEISIELEDDGVGFRLDRVPRDRIGVRTSIQQRIASIGGKAVIKTQPGQGTLVRLEWSK